MNSIKKNSCLALLLSFFAIFVSHAMNPLEQKEKPDIKAEIKVCFYRNVFNFNHGDGFLSAEELCKQDDSFEIGSDNKTGVYFKESCEYNRKDKKVNITGPLERVVKFVYNVGKNKGRGEGNESGFLLGKQNARKEFNFIQRHPKKSAFGFTILGAAIPTSILGWMWWKTRN